MGYEGCHNSLKYCLSRSMSVSISISIFMSISISIYVYFSPACLLLVFFLLVRIDRSKVKFQIQGFSLVIKTSDFCLFGVSLSLFLLFLCLFVLLSLHHALFF
jgi:hypothetical protein